MPAKFKITISTNIKKWMADGNKIARQPITAQTAVELGKETRRWVHRFEKRVFSTEGSANQSGKWKSLTPAYAAVKAKKFGNQKINQRTGISFHTCP